MINIELKNYWNEEMYKKDKEIWGDECSYAAKYFVKYLEEHKCKLSTILDLGCGYGRDSVYFDHVGLKVCGIDFAEEGIRIAKEKYKNLEFLVGDIQKLPFDDNVFDICFCNYVIHWFNEEERKKAILEAYRVTRKNGLVVFSIPKFGSEENDVIFTYNEVTYTKTNVINEFEIFDQKDIFDLKEFHTHGGDHLHDLYMIVVRKYR